MYPLIKEKIVQVYCGYFRWFSFARVLSSGYIKLCLFFASNEEEKSIKLKKNMLNSVDIQYNYIRLSIISGFNSKYNKIV